MVLSNRAPNEGLDSVRGGVFIWPIRDFQAVSWSTVDDFPIKICGSELRLSLYSLDSRGRGVDVRFCVSSMYYYYVCCLTGCRDSLFWVLTPDLSHLLLFLKLYIGKLLP